MISPFFLIKNQWISFSPKSLKPKMFPTILQLGRAIIEFNRSITDIFLTVFYYASFSYLLYIISSFSVLLFHFKPLQKYFKFCFWKNGKCIIDVVPQGAVKLCFSDSSKRLWAGSRPYKNVNRHRYSNKMQHFGESKQT